MKKCETCKWWTLVKNQYYKEQWTIGWCGGLVDDVDVQIEVDCEECVSEIKTVRSFCCDHWEAINEIETVPE